MADAVPVIKQGWFKKEGTWGFSRRRYVVLQGNLLSYFSALDASGNPQDCRGTVDLSTAMSVVAQRSEIQIVTSERTWSFTADSERECEEWAEAIVKASGVAKLGHPTSMKPAPVGNTLLTYFSSRIGWLARQL